QYRSELDADLDAAVATLAGEGITITLYRLDAYALGYRLAADPEGFGFTKVTDSGPGPSVHPGENLFLDDLHSTPPRHYQIASAAFTVLNGTALPPARALNLSARLNVGTGDDVLIGGFIVSGTESKQVLVRGLGPSLAVNGVPLADRLSDPAIDLYQGN